MPAGYLAAEFLESTGYQRIVLPEVADNDTGAILRAATMNYNDKPPVGINYNGRWYLPSPSLENVIKWGWQDNNELSINTRLGYCYTAIYNWKNDRKVIWDGAQVGTLKDITFTTKEIIVFGYQWGGLVWELDAVRIFSLALTQRENVVRDFIPAIDKNGVPCMFDKVTKQPFYNSGTGSFIVGLTLPQARKLGKLPSTGGALTISLPSNWQEDDVVVYALATAEANGWVLTYQTYEADASASSTFALRRIFVRKTQDAKGQYIDADGSRWHVEWCAGMIGAEPTDYGYEPFRSVDSAVAYWGLTPYVAPEAEIFLTNQEQ